MMIFSWALFVLLGFYLGGTLLVQQERITLHRMHTDVAGYLAFSVMLPLRLGNIETIQKNPALMRSLLSRNENLHKRAKLYLEDAAKLEYDPLLLLRGESIRKAREDYEFMRNIHESIEHVFHDAARETDGDFV